MGERDKYRLGRRGAVAGLFLLVNQSLQGWLEEIQ